MPAATPSRRCPRFTNALWGDVSVPNVAGCRAFGPCLVPAAVLLLSLSAVASPDPPSLPPRGPDWAHDAVDKLCRRGLLAGYERGPFPGPRDLTRPEGASLTLRAAEGVAQLLRESGQRLSAALESGAAAPAPGADGQQPAGLSPEDLAAVRRLIAEFAPELDKLGASVANLEQAVADLQTRLKAVEASAKAHRVYGYLQLRFDHDEATKGRTEFLLRRARVNVAGPIADRTSYRIEFQLDAREEKSVVPDAARGSKIQVRSAYVDQKLGTGRLRVGQAKIPFGYEVLESVPDLWTGERSVVMDALIPDQRDIGVQYRLTDRSERLAFDLGVFNGTGINRVDDNDAKDFAGRLEYDFGPASGAVSYYGGTEGDNPSSKGDRLGLGARGAIGDFEGMGEYVVGNEDASDVAGWYAQAGWHVPRVPGLLFVKHDEYDPDTDAPDTTFRCTAIGYRHDLNEQTQLSLVYEVRDADAGYPKFDSANGDHLFLQMQSEF